MLSAHAEVEHATDLIASGERTGYLLKSRVTDVTDFIETLTRVMRGGSAVDSALVQKLVRAHRVDDPLPELTSREREVLALLAEGLSNAGIGRALWVTEATVEKHVRSILMKLPLPDSDEVHRRCWPSSPSLTRNDGPPRWVSPGQRSHDNPCYLQCRKARGAGSMVACSSGA